MRRALLALSLGCLLGASPAYAQPHPGVALSWNHCFGEGTGTSLRTFACDTNSGFEELIGSFAIGEDMANVLGNEILVGFSTAEPYAYPYVGPPLPEWWKAVGAYVIDYAGQGTARLTMAVAVSATSLRTLYAGIEYYSFTLRIAHVKTVGMGACGGCGTPMYITLRQINVTTDTPANNRAYAGPLNGASSDLAMWNEYPVPTRAASWGAVKSLYR